MAASPKKSAKRDLKFPKKWATLEDIFEWVTVKGFEDPTDDESRKLWLVSYDTPLPYKDLRNVARDLSGIESIVYVTMSDGIQLVLFTFKSQRTIKYIRDNDVLSSYSHANFVKNGKKKEFILHLLRGGCVVVPDDKDVVIKKPGTTSSGWKVELCEEVTTILSTDHLFVRENEDEGNKSDGTDEEVVKSSSSEDEE